MRIYINATFRILYHLLRDYVSEIRINDYLIDKINIKGVSEPLTLSNFD